MECLLNTRESPVTGDPACVALPRRTTFLVPTQVQSPGRAFPSACGARCPRIDDSQARGGGIRDSRPGGFRPLVKRDLRLAVSWSLLCSVYLLPLLCRPPPTYGWDRLSAIKTKGPWAPARDYGSPGEVSRRLRASDGVQPCRGRGRIKGLIRACCHAERRSASGTWLWRPWRCRNFSFTTPSLSLPLATYLAPKFRHPQKAAAGVRLADDKRAGCRAFSKLVAADHSHMPCGQEIRGPFSDPSKANVRSPREPPLKKAPQRQIICALEAMSHRW